VQEETLIYYSFCVENTKIQGKHLFKIFPYFMCATFTNVFTSSVFSCTCMCLFSECTLSVLIIITSCAHKRRGQVTKRQKRFNEICLQDCKYHTLAHTHDIFIRIYMFIRFIHPVQGRSVRFETNAKGAVLTRTGER
jgi:hypothetical protein